MQHENFPQIVLDAVNRLKARGYGKISVVLCEEHSLYAFPCMGCGRILSSVNGVNIFAPYSREERAYVYFACDDCRRKIDWKTFDEIENRLALARAVSKRMQYTDL